MRLGKIKNTQIEIELNQIDNLFIDEEHRVSKGFETLSLIELCENLHIGYSNKNLEAADGKIRKELSLYENQSLYLFMKNIVLNSLNEANRKVNIYVSKILNEKEEEVKRLNKVIDEHCGLLE